MQGLRLLFVFILIAVSASAVLSQANEAIDEAERFIQGTWRLEGQIKGQQGRAFGWFLEYTFNRGEFKQTGYPPLLQTGRYRIAKREGDKLTIELTHQDGTFGKEDRNLEILIESERTS